ncbi:23234_t:CDS:2 [Rhizophagus irregularis]|nr:23234_t:CDS:2 [Rhizophagus irregularis]
MRGAPDRKDAKPAHAGKYSESKLLLSEETSRDGCAVNGASGDTLRNTSAQNLEAKGQIVQV